MSKHHWKNGAGRLAKCKFVTNFQFVNAVPAKFNKDSTGTSLVVQWLGLCAPSAGAQVRFLVRELWIPYAATEDPVYHNRSGIAK